MTDPAAPALDDLLIQALAYEWGRDEKNSIAALVHGLATHAARIPQLQAMLDARAADLGRFTQSAVAKTKELETRLAEAEADRDALRARLVEAPCVIDEHETDAETLRQARALAAEVRKRQEMHHGSSLTVSRLLNLLTLTT